MFGAAGLSTATQEQADPLLDVLLEFGVNHWDTAADYGGAEDRLAPWLAIHRDDVFLATKTGDRTADGARASLERSLQRMGVDHVDLIQLHNLVEEDEWQTAHAPGGAVEALVAARDEGLTRFIGVTGHGLRIAAMHARSLERFDYDSVLLPYNFVQLEDASTAPTSSTSSACAPSATWRCRRSRRWPGVAGPTTQRVRGDPGTSRCRRAMPWNTPCATSSIIEQLFLVSSADPNALRATLAVASRSGAAPTPDQLRDDVATAGIQPLFDGEQLERI